MEFELVEVKRKIGWHRRCYAVQRNLNLPKGDPDA
jgi:hypothetical protein